MKTQIQTRKQIRNYLKEHSDAILNINLDENVFKDIIDLFVHQRNHGGKIITTGMGKAGIVMRKFSSMLCSLGFPSMYLHPGEASHGDMGLLTANDILFVASTSGKTREILEIIDLAKDNIKTIIGITSHLDSPIKRKAQYVIDMGLIKESGHLNIAPTTSMVIMMIITDCIAMMAAKQVNLTIEEYGKYHHGGYLGQIARSVVPKF
ncbi:MAG: SIS domain-containing protein [bacterium]